jgi:beta-glucuronidase
MRYIITILLITTCWASQAQSSRTPLNGQWLFALDPMKVGEQQQWYKPAFADKTLDKVTVPNCYSTDPRYFYHTGNAWYYKLFDAPATPASHRVFIRFEAVFYKANIWLNGKHIGFHEGGYTPFEIEVTGNIQSKNTLAVQVNNEWDTTTLPGAKTVDTSYRPNASQLYAWMNYGGIVKPVHILVRPATFISNMKVAAEPELKKGTAQLTISSFINGPTTDKVNLQVYRQGRLLSLSFKTTEAAKQDGKTILISTAQIPAADVQLWSVDDPQLYEALAILEKDTVRTKFGIRKLAVKGVQLLLNGKPIRMGGANRPTDYPGYGSIDPDSVVFKDLQLMKQAGMEFSRIAHHAVSENILHWADEHGMLIITEAGNWQMTPKQMADSMMQRKYRSQLKEMVERDWNHACVVAYSLGNEFYSHTEPGKAWVRNMKAYVRSMDTTRLITFASYIVFRDYVKKPEDEASQYVDFICTNIYGKHQQYLEHIHELYPNKPIYISEFGTRATPDKPEQDRINYLNNAMEVFRKYDYVAGASVWTFNDYLSRYPETDANGYRAWGLVDAQRKPRAMYDAWQQAFAPAVVTQTKKTDGTITVSVGARKDFPAYTLKGYVLRVDGKEYTLPVLEPGNATTVAITGQTDKDTYIELVKPGGFVILQQLLLR